MSPRAAELLLAAARHLPPEERDELLVALLSRLLDGPAPPDGPAPEPLPAGAGAMPPVDDRPGPFRAGTEDVALRVLPVRLPVGDHERLRAFAREHGVSMAVVVRTLVERFLAAQARRQAARQDDPDDDPDVRAGTGHA